MLGQKITFTPGSAEIDVATAAVMDALATALTDCDGLAMEIAGHTDAQGSEDGNRALSQARAEAVLLALQGRRVDVSAMRATGYGEARPIADNGEEAGRDANRRIEFTLITPPQAEAPNPELAVSDTAAVLGTEPSAGPAQPAIAATGDAAAPAADALAQSAGGPDFSGDTSPSIAPTEMTLRPVRRPQTDG